MGIALQMHNIVVESAVSVSPYSADMKAHAGYQVDENEQAELKVIIGQAAALYFYNDK